MAPRFTLMLVSAAAAALTITTIPAGPAGRAEAAQAKQQRARSVVPLSRQNWARFLQSFIDGEFRAQPAFAVTQGRHEYDGQLPDWSATGLHNERMRLRSAMAAAQAFNPRGLTREQRFERDYLIAHVRGELFWLDVADQPHTNPAYYMNNGLDPSVYVTRPYAPAATRLRAYIGYLREIPRAARQIRANLRTPLPLPPELSIHGVRPACQNAA